jgi:cell division septal protein FtsQ
MLITAPADKRFRRAHIRPSRKHAGRLSLRWRLVRCAVGLVAAAYAGHWLVSLVADAGALRVTHVVVQGNQRLSNGEVLALLDGLRGESILGADLGHWRDRLLNSPWVADASLRRELPSTVDVVIAEREPFGIGRFASGLYLIDERGTIIDEYGPNYAELDLPIVDGLAVPSAEGSLAIDQVRAELAMRLLRAVRVRNLGRRISQVDVTDARNAVVILAGDPAWIRLGDDHFFERLQSYLDLAATRTPGAVDGARGVSLDRRPKGSRGSNEG